MGRSQRLRSIETCVTSLTFIWLGWEANYASSGQAFGEDDVIQSDMTLCKSITETLQ